MRVWPLLLLFVAQTARADGFYATESFGGTKITDKLGDSISGAFRIRVSVGWRHRQFALEGFVAGDLSTDEKPGAYYGPPAALTTYGFDLKYIRPVMEHVEFYLRGTISRGSTDGVLDGYSGRGLGMGAGAQLKGKVRALGFLAWPLFFTGIGPKVTGALFIDDGVDFLRLHKGGDQHAASVDAQLSHLTFGFAVGSDF
jgi:hypothetical protein